MTTATMQQTELRAERMLDGFVSYDIMRGQTQQTDKGPVNPVSEFCVIGSAMWLTASDIQTVALIVEPHDFYYKPLGKLWGVIVAQARKGVALDDCWVAQREMENAGHGGAPKYFEQGKNWAWTLLSCASFVVKPGNADYHARIVRDCSLHRQAIRECSRAASAAGDSITSPEILASQMIAEAEKIQRRKIDSAKTKVSEMGEDLFSRMAQNQAARGAAITVGIFAADRLVSIQRGEYVVLAARPSVGKSAMATQIAYRAAQAGIGTVIFSFEMNRYAVWNRIFAQVCKVNASRATRSNLGDAELQLYYDFLTNNRELPLWIEDSEGHDPRKARALVQQRITQGNNIGLVIFDHLQLAHWDNTARSRYELITNASGALASMAHELNIVVLALSQMARPVEKTKSRIPALHDLRESGAIEQDADTVIFLHRTTSPSESGIVATDFFVAKQRNGSVGATRLVFNGNYVSFAASANQNGAQPGAESEETPY